MAGVGVRFLQTSLETEPKNVNSYKPGATDIIRLMLREQKKECEILHSNPLFREFKQLAKYKGKDQLGLACPPVLEDVEAEAKMRTLEFIRKAAQREGKIQKGVWASFGKPYVCLGEPTEPEKSLPQLFRDELNRASSPTKHGKSRHASRGKICKRPHSTRQTVKHTVEELEQDKLLEKQALMKFSSKEYKEAKFPEVPIKMATTRRSKAIHSSMGFIDRFQAEEEASDPTAYGVLSHMVSIGGRSERTKTAPAKSIETADRDSSTKRFTPCASMKSVNEGRKSILVAALGRPGQGGRDSHGNDGAEKGFDPQAFRIPAPPKFRNATELARPGLADEDNPVFKWHNRFVEVRHVARKNLQIALWERVQRRKLARSSAELATGVSTSMITEMDTRPGARPTACCSPNGLVPTDPWRKGMRVVANSRGKCSRGLPVNLSPANLEDIRLMESFYDQLCFLVESLKQSDPVSLMVVQQVKTLLEAGHTLHRPLLRKVIEHIAEFINGCGLLRYNKYLLSILTFIRKCVGVSEDDMAHMVRSFGVTEVIYSGDGCKPVNTTKVRQESAVNAPTSPRSKKNA